METFLALLVVAGFGYFIYTRIQKSKKGGSSTGGGGSRGDENDININ